MSCANGAIPDALFIVNSLRCSSLPPQPPTKKGGGLLMPKLDHEPIDFGQPVSPALSAHCLLHYFARNGMSLRARHLAERLMQDGTQIRAATLHAVIQCQTGRANFILARRPSERRPFEILTKQVEDEGTRLAVKLLLHARQHRQRCHEHTYQFIINICLVQGEIIVASLLFVLLIKDWEMKRAATQVREQAKLTEELPATRHRSLHASSPPSKRILKMILSKAQEGMMLDAAEESNWPRREAALQALCNLAGLLDARLLPYTDISSIIRTLYSVPKVPDKVWVRESGNQAMVQAHRYIHRVLLRLASDPSSSSAGACPERSDAMPPLTHESYNALLHYALRHRQSTCLAKSLLHHMKHERHPPLRPVISTYNVIIRSGSLLRQNDLTELALQELRKLEENRQHAIMVKPSPVVSFAAGQSKVQSEEGSKWTMALKHPKASQPPLEMPLKADAFTLTSYVQHVTATGNPDIVADILFRVLPELSIIDHPSWGSVTEEQRAFMRTESRQMRLTRAISLGPWFFIVILNALCKAGKTGLAERVWLLAKQAERASWTGAIGIDGKPIKPWCLPIHAYTIMLQCYGAEARRGLELRRPKKPKANDWTPKIGSNQVQGWARFVLAQNAASRKHRSRRALALLMGVTLYRIMHRAAAYIYDTLYELRDVGQVALKPPRPDARFFNAALQMFGQQPRTFQRSSHNAPAHWRHKATLANVQFSRLGVRPRNWNPFLGRVVKEMHALGFKVPSGFKRLFTGRWPYGFEEYRHRPELNEQPFAFPKSRRSPFRPHALGTRKTRGLPVRNMKWRMLGRRYRWKHRRRRKSQYGGKVR